MAEPVTIVNPVTLEVNTNSSVPERGQVLTVIGLGATSEGGNVSDVLQEVDVYTISWEACNGPYSGEGSPIEDEVMFCAGKDPNKSIFCNHRALTETLRLFVSCFSFRNYGRRPRQLSRRLWRPYCSPQGQYPCPSWCCQLGVGFIHGKMPYPHAQLFLLLIQLHFLGFASFHTHPCVIHCPQIRLCPTQLPWCLRSYQQRDGLDQICRLPMLGCLQCNFLHWRIHQLRI